MTTSEAPVGETLAAITAASLENSDLSLRELMIARISALAAMDAPAVSYGLNVGAAAQAGITLADVQNILVAVAPIIGTARVVSSTLGLAQGLGFVIGLTEDESEGE
jgi:hypothetical protein